MKLPPAMKGHEARDALIEYRRTGDVAHRNRAARGCMAFVASRAHRFGRHGRNIDDLMQAGCEGLLHSFETYDPAKGAVTTHARQWIDRFIIIHMRDVRSMVRLPTKSTSVTAVVGAMRDGAETVDDIVRAIHATKKPGSYGVRYDVAAGIMTLLTSRDVGDEFTHLASRAVPQDEAIDDALMRQAVSDALGSLSTREREIVERMFWGDERGKDIADDFGVTKQRVWQTLQQAFVKMRRELREVA